ncbi:MULTISPECIES: hypothetical protein [unclassified Mesorhizobium]|jgi:hypothetical protein|nr:MULTISPECIES: hypothetical protein [unclassified Mesorhizobium]MDG4893377.1 hypothetical protein [Mesorhizobium sp. WSM4976]
MTRERAHHSRICRPAADQRATTYRAERLVLAANWRATTPRL